MANNKNVLYNTKTRQPEVIPEAKLAEALASGTHAYKNDAVINVVGADGEVRNVDSAELRDAMEQGFMPETSRQAAVRQYVEENKGLKGTLKVGLGQFADEALLSIPETVYDLTADPLDVAKKEALKKEHELANTLGGVGGFGASMFVGGPLFKAAGVAGRATERAILGGAERVGVAGAERVAEEAAAQTAARGAEGFKAGAAGAESVVGEEAARYAPHINPDVGVSEAAGRAEDVFQKEYRAVSPSGTGAQSEEILNQLGKGTRELPPGGTTKQLGGRTDELAVRPGEAPPQLGGRTDELGFPDMEGEVIGNPSRGQLGPGGIPLLESGKFPPIKGGTIETEGIFGAKDSLLNNMATDQGTDVLNFKSLMTPGRTLTEAEKAAGVTTEAVAANVKAIKERLIAQGVSTAEAEHAAAGLVRRTIAAAANQGVQAGIIAAPKSITEAMLGDPNEAAEHLFMNIAAGGIFGVAGELSKSALRSLAPKFSNMAEDQAFRNLMATRNLKASKQAEEIPGGVRGIGRTLLNENLIKNVGEDFTSYADRLNTGKEEVGAKISGLYAEMDQVNKDVLLSDTYKLGAMFRDKVIAPLSVIPGNEGIINKVTKYVESFERIGEGRSLGFVELHNWRKGLDDLIWREGAIGITDPAKKELAKVRALITHELEEKGNQVASTLGRNFSQELNSQNILFRQLKVATDTAEHSAAQEISNRYISPSDYLSGIGSSIAGGPIAGIAGAFAHKALREEGNALAAKGLDALGGMQTKISGILMAEKAMKRSADKIRSIPEMVGNAWKVSPDTFTTVHLNAMTRFIGNRKEENMREQYDQLIAKLDKFNNNPTDQVAGITQHLENGGAPNIANAMTIKYHQALGQLAASAPRPILQPSPFESPAVQKAKGMVSDGDIAEFAKRIAVINDPFIVFRKIGAGTVSSKEVQTLKDFYPSLYQRGLDLIMQHPQQLNYAQRANLDLYSGSDVAGSQGSAMNSQGASKKKKGKAPPDIGVIGPKASGKKFDIRANSSMTQVQSLFSKRSK